MANIFLIGYMGAGKTTVGKRLAAQLGRPFVDMDLFIENRYRKRVSELFAEKGEEFFRKIEHAVLQEVSQFENTVIATGGGSPCFFDNMERMNRTGVTIYLQVSAATLTQRLGLARQRRPLVKGKGAEKLERFVTEHLAQREEWYRQASFQCSMEQIYPAAVSETIEHIIQLINEIEA
jgi:shikimate kinase